MKNLKKAEPVAVSECVPVYVNGRVKYYNVHVEYMGDLFLNSEQSAKMAKWAKEDPGAFNADSFNHKMLPLIIRHDINIPRLGHFTGQAKYDSTTKTSTMWYGWRRGLFGLGFRNAEKFRQQMLAQINENNQITR